MNRKRQEKKAQREKSIKYFDYNLLFIIIFLLCFGLVMLYSTSSYSGATKFGDAAYFLKKQIFATSLGIVFMFVLSKIDYHFWRKLGGLAYLVALALCTAVIFIGHESNGSARWIYIGPISFQPSEFAKLAVILFLAMVIYRVPKQMSQFKSLVKVMATVLPIVGVVAYNNLSTAIIILGIAVCMLFVSSPKYFHFIVMGITVFVVGVIFILAESYRGTRIQIWLDPTSHPKGYQTLQGLYAIGSGGLFGKGLGESMQKLGFIPEAQNDMIFSVICEELGLFGAVCVIVLFLLLLWRLMIIANNASDLYGALIVVGIMAHLAIQVVLNIAVVTNTIPNTGISLPFISYGGTSILFLLSEMGLALSVSRGIRLDVT